MTKRLQIDYNDELHEYRCNGQRGESVTECLPFISSAPLDRILNKQEIGKAVHAWIEKIILGQQSAFSLNVLSQAEVESHAACLGYIKSYQRAVDELGLRPAVDFEGAPICERIVWHPLYGYAGRIDLVAYSERLGIPPDQPVMLDLKTVATLSPVTSLQCSGYLEAYNAYWKGKAPQAKHRAALRLKPDGSLPEFRVYPASEHKADFAVFLNMLGSYRWFSRVYRSKVGWEEIVGGWMERWTPPMTGEKVEGVAF